MIIKLKDKSVITDVKYIRIASNGMGILYSKYYPKDKHSEALTYLSYKHINQIEEDEKINHPAIATD